MVLHASFLQVISARRTESIDAPAILDLVDDQTHHQFGRVNIVHLIEKANLSVTLSNEENEVYFFHVSLNHVIFMSIDFANTGTVPILRCTQHNVRSKKLSCIM